MTNKRLKIENLQDLNIRELTEEEVASLQGGMIVADKPFEPLYSYPIPNIPINNVPCTNYPTNGLLPWCAVVL